MRWAKEKEKEKGRELVPAGERVAEEDEEEDEDVKSEELMELEDEEGEFTWNGMKVVGGPNWGNAGWYRNNRWTGSVYLILGLFRVDC